MLDLPNSFLAWVQVVAIPAGVLINSVIAYIAVRSVLPKQQRLAAYLVNKTEQTEGTLGQTRTISTTNIWSIGIKNLGPNDVVDVRIPDTPDESRWWKSFPNVFYPFRQTPAQLSEWEASYIPVDGEALILLDLGYRGTDAQKELVLSNDPVIENLKVEYKTLEGRTKRASLRVSYSSLRAFIRSLYGLEAAE